MYIGNQLVWEKLEEKKAFRFIVDLSLDGRKTLYFLAIGDFFVDWGDGTDVEEWAGTINDDMEVTHTYAESISYIITITGDLMHFRCFGDVISKTLTNVLDPLPATVYPEILVNNQNRQPERMFSGCYNLLTIPNELFKYCYYAENFSSVFEGCQSLKEIPSDIFKGCVKATNFSSAFRGCGYVDSKTGKPKADIVITKDLFTDCVKAERFDSVFQYSGLKTIPKGLFDNNVKAYNFNSAFADTYILEIPENLFLYNNAYKFDSTFEGCENITDVPLIFGTLDDSYDTVNETTGQVTIMTIDCGNIFNGCTNLKTVHTDLFISIGQRLYIVEKAFKNCSSMEVAPMTYNVLRFETGYYYDSKTEQWVQEETSDRLYEQTGIRTGAQTIGCYEGCVSMTNPPTLYLPSDTPVSEVYAYMYAWSIDDKYSPYN
jgi:hypothetical protein